MTRLKAGMTTPHQVLRLPYQRRQPKKMSCWHQQHRSFSHRLKVHLCCLVAMNIVPMRAFAMSVALPFHSRVPYKHLRSCRMKGTRAVSQGARWSDDSVLRESGWLHWVGE